MSEFSESYHLRSERAEDAIDLLRHTGLKGYVFKPSDGWVTFVIENPMFKPDPKIVTKSDKLLLHYVCAEDHGWGFTLFDRGKAASAYRCEWDPDLSVEDSKYSREALQHLLPFADTILLDEFENDMRPTSYHEAVGADVSKTFARAVGLEHYDWVAYHYIERDFRFSRSRTPDVIVVS